jgi:hypothetical protein
MSMLRTRYGPALSLPTTDGHELERPNNGSVGPVGHLEKPLADEGWA